MNPRLLLHERTNEGGALERTWLEAADGALFLEIEGGARKLVPAALLDAVMKRYGRPLSEDIALEGTPLVIEGRSVHAIRHLARYDVIAKDFLVVSGVADEPLAELSTAVTAALVYLLRDVPSVSA